MQHNGVQKKTAKNATNCANVVQAIRTMGKEIRGNRILVEYVGKFNGACKDINSTTVY